MDFDYVVNSRKTIRKYTTHPVSFSELRSIIEAGILAPSAKNRQPWRFFILNDIQKKKIVSMMLNWEQNNKDLHTSVKGSAIQMEQADKAIIIYSPIYHSKNKKTYYKKPDYLSLGAAIENMSLKCSDLGLGSSWLCDTLYIEDEINHYLSISDFEQISTLLIGHPKEIPARRERFHFNDVLLNHFPDE